MAHDQDTTLLDIHITKASCESSHLLNDHNYRLKLSRDSINAVIGVQRTKSTRSQSGSGTTSWENPFEGRFTLNTSRPKTSVVVKVVRSGYFVHHRTVGTFVLNHTDVPSSGVLTTSLFSRDGGEIGTVTYSLGVSHSNPLAHTADSDKALDKMVLGPIIAAPLPGYEPVVGAIMSQASAWDVLATRLQRLEGVIRVVDELSQIHPWVSLAWGVFSVAYKMFAAQNNRDQSVEQLVIQMNASCDFVDQASPLKDRSEGHKEIIGKILQQVVECAYFVRDYAKDKSFGLRLVKYAVAGLEAQIEEYKASLQALRESLTTHATIHSTIQVHRILDIAQQTQDGLVRIQDTVDATHALLLLGEMRYTSRAHFDVEQGCFPNTRVAVTDSAFRWVSGVDSSYRNKNPNGEDGLMAGSWAALCATDSSRVLWICGEDGTGKTAIVKSIASRYTELRRLGSVYAFDQNMPSETNAGNLFSTIARDLADLDPLRKTRLLSIIKDSTAIRRSSNSRTQFSSFIVSPAGDVPTVGVTLIVIDALDESGDVNARAELVAVLTKLARNIPDSIRIIVTSRFDSDIRIALEQNHEGVDYILMDSISPKETLHDVSVFISNQLRHVPSLSSDPSVFDEYVERLSTKAGASFQWAATACESISTSADPVQQLKNLLGTRDGVDGLYSAILQTEVDALADDPENGARLHSLLSHIATTQEPLSLRALAGLLADESDSLFDEELSAQRDIAQRLAAVLSGTARDDTPVTPRHASFRHFLCDEERSGPLCVKSQISNRQLALGCLRAMETGLRLNICQIPTSSKRNKDIEGLQSLLSDKVSPQLLYSCRFWAYHIASLDVLDEVIIQKLSSFFTDRFLYWLEVMSLSQSKFVEALGLLSGLPSISPELSSLLRDAQRFTAMFAAPITTSAPHIYLSALSFAPTCSALVRHLRESFNRYTIPVRGLLPEWPNVVGIMEGHTRQVNCVAFSPDGSKAVSGSSDSTIRIWDISTLTAVGGPLKGHTGPVTAVAFSPDGSHIVSASQDHSLRRWDAIAGEPVGEPIRGHEDDVLCAAYSADGKLIASGSRDKSIRLWNSVTGANEGVLNGHSQEVTCVIYSPDASIIASSSNDGTIRIWSTMGQKIEGDPLVGHTGHVTSLAFAPDGRRLVSASEDNTLRVWDIKTRACVCGPMVGHGAPIVSVAFSPDGTRVASGSWDSTVRVWDSGDGARVGQPFRGHSNPVTSIAFSPDGKFLLSGSADNSLRVWDSTAVPFFEESSKGHTQSVTSVVFFPDGSKIASGSDDCTLRIWDVNTGGSIEGPLRGHTSPVVTIDISPDGKQLVSGSDDATLRVWDTSSGNRIGNPLRGHTKPITCAAFSPDGTQIASGSLDTTLRLWDSGNRTALGEAFRGHTNWVQSVSYSPDGSRLASSSLEQKIKVWDVQARGVVLELSQGHSLMISSVAFSPDGSLIASGSWDKTIRLWDAVTGESIGEPMSGHAKSVTSIAFSRDGKRIASGSTDRTVRVWDVETRKALGEPLRAHSAPITCVTFSPDGKKLASSSRDKTVRVWDLQVDTLEESEASNTHLQYPVELFPKRTFSLRDGWILGPEGELTIWVPPAHRVGLCHPNSRCIGSPYTTELDFTNFSYASNWGKVMKHVSFSPSSLSLASSNVTS